MPIMHKPAAAWSRDSLSSWQYVADKLMPSVGSADHHNTVHFLHRWAIKIVTLVSEEMPWSDWYYFLSNHFKRELDRMEPGFTGRHPVDVWLPGGENRETDPQVENAE
jgi:hypothetical protein